METAAIIVLTIACLALIMVNTYMASIVSKERRDFDNRFNAVLDDRTSSAPDAVKEKHE